MKIPFNIKYRPQIESGEYKVETRDGNIVTILEWDIFIHGMAHMILIQYNEKYDFVNSNGRVNRTGLDCNLDLFIITKEPELSEFEKELERFYNHHLQVCTYDNQGTVEDSLHDGASKLLTIARKQLIEERYTSDPRKTDLYKLGKAEVLNSLPRWKIADRDIISNNIEFAVPYMNDGGDHADWVEIIVTNAVNKGKNYFEISELEKLPGFNE